MRVFGWISVACATLFVASVANAGGAPTPSCIVGVYTTSDVFYLDANGNGTFDGSTTDSVFRIAPGLGAGSFVLGDFAAGGGDGVGKYIADSGGFFALDLNENNTWDGNGGGDRARQFVASQNGGAGFIGVWSGQTQASVGRYLLDSFFIDDNANGVWDGAGTDARFAFIPSLTAANSDVVLGDWNGDGETDVARYDTVNARLFVDLDGDRVWEGVGGGDVNTPFGKAFADANGGGEIVVGDWDGDGDDNIALFVSAADTFLVDLDGDFIWDGVGGGDALVQIGASLAAPNTADACDFDGSAGDELNKFNPAGVAFMSDENGNRATDAGEIAAFAPALAGSIEDGFGKDN